MTGRAWKPARARRAWTPVAALGRVLALLVLLEVGGLVHAVMDVVTAVANIQHDEERCPPNGPCDDCPAGCPNCHCPNALGAVLPASAPAALVDLTAAVAARPLLDRGRAPEGPDLPSLYRPPRSTARS